MKTRKWHSILGGKRGGLLLVGVLMGGVLLFSSLAVGEARDADGSRLQARSIKLSSTQRDTLLPPRDSVDWRSFKVTADGSILISVSHKPAKASVRVSLTDARGSQLGSASSSSGSASIRKTLKPGVYYVSVSSGDKVSYSISVK